MTQATHKNSELQIGLETTSVHVLDVCSTTELLESPALYGWAPCTLILLSDYVAAKPTWCPCMLTIESPIVQCMLRASVFTWLERPWAVASVEVPF